MDKLLMKGLPRLEVQKDTVCAGCQYGKVIDCHTQKPSIRSGQEAISIRDYIHSDSAQSNLAFNLLVH